MNGLNDATLAQIRAANPQASTWVSANAGSGKTRVLTDRVALLLLRGTPPQKILCLTYTKAAASHMQNQLFDRLGKWAMLDDRRLTDTLAELGESVQPENLPRARTLFARALEAPGGLKIQTIHSFCAALLRRFPLEAGVSPQFQEIDDQSARRLQSDILEDMAGGPAQAVFDGMARHLSGDDTESLIQEITRNRSFFSSPVTRDQIWRTMGLTPGYDWPDLLADAFPSWINDILPDLITALQTGLDTDTKNAAKLAKIDPNHLNKDALLQVEPVFLFGTKAQKNPDGAKIGGFPTKDLRLSIPDLMQAVEVWMQQIELARQNRRALEAAHKTAALHRFAAAFLPDYAARKSHRGWLDFDDLIFKARDLLTDSATAQWILYRLDGGIDHILVDEAQDTSPAQWDVITKLAEEFTTGLGASGADRSIFVVGDEKQSIYSFQGADPQAFGQMRDHFSRHLNQINQRMEYSELLFSFRSAKPILRLVDAVVQNSDGAGLPNLTTHRAFHQNLPGRVDLWPFLPKTKNEDPASDWFDPVDQPSPDDPVRLLAGHVADQIRGILASNASYNFAGVTRALTPGDVLVLVQQRAALFREIIVALKERGIPVAGADRLKIGTELAVKDLLAMLSFMALPEDDLSLACAMRSPLLGLSEAQLYTVAQGRGASLWQSLRNAGGQFDAIKSTLNALLKDVDFLRPFELLERILTTHNGRINLIARLGPESEDGIDALLGEALRYEQAEAPSLTGFLGWMESGDVEIKRQMESKSDQVRVMTVHGAKGLESPVVILPDTAKRKRGSRNALAPLDTGLMAWKTASDDSPDVVATARNRQNDLQEQENRRLLYVALTRAENWLIVCGAGDPGQDQDSWYTHVAQAMETVSATPAVFGIGAGLRYENHHWQPAKAVAKSSNAQASTALPPWASRPAPKVEAARAPLSPSDLGGAKIMPGDGAGLNEENAKEYGRQIHLLLEHLPGHPPENWSELARRLLSGDADRVDAKDTQALLDEVSPILKDPGLAFLFAPDTLAEVAVTARIAAWDNQRINGVIDRLICDKTRILAVDFKSNTQVPPTAAKVPEGLLRQMAAYNQALTQIYPQTPIETAILWTKSAELMRLPHDIVTRSFNTTPIP